MLLRHLYDFAVSRKLLDDLAFVPKAVRWIIDLDGDGHLIGLGPQPTGDDKRGKEMLCPFTTRNKNVGGVAEFLADGLSGLFGLDPEPEAPLSAKKRADRDANNADKWKDFWLQIARAARHFAPGDHRELLRAVLKFRKQRGRVRMNALPWPLPEFLRWGRAVGSKPGDKPAWWIRSAAGNEVRLDSANFTFRVNRRLLLEDERLRNWWRAVHAKEVASTNEKSEMGLCLVTGKSGVKIAETHTPSIKRVKGAQPSGAKIVSFEKSAPAFASFGLVQSLNAPTSNEAATAYCTALNWLTARNDHSLHLGGTTLCFWARETESASGIFAQLLNRPDPKAVADFHKMPWSGIKREFARKDQFFAVTLAGNSGRIVVRHWLEMSLERAIENLDRWFADLALAVPPCPKSKQPKKRKAGDAAEGGKESMPPLAIFRLACTTVREVKDLPLEVPSQLYRAALEGTAPSISLIKPILNQLHSKLVRDENYTALFDETRFAFLKLILNRNRKDTMPEIRPRLTADTDDAAYNSGRLLAVLAAAQDKAHDFKLEGPGVAERYFGTASVSPGSVFPLLLRLNRHHLNKIAKSDRYAGHERFLEAEIQNILSLFGQTEDMRARRLPPNFPRTLDLQSQGRFALGFYQQMAADADARAAARPAAAQTPEPQKQ